MSLKGNDGEGPRPLHPSLFHGKTFWLSQNVPQRSRFRDIIQQNGGIVKLFEKDADIRLVDHTRKNLPPDTYSFRYVENSVRKGQLDNLEVYRAGPSAARPVGATNIPSRGHKIPYSIGDDQILWDWMQPFERDPHAPIGGNKIYQDLAAQYPRHTYQSYRDRYLKRLRGRPRPGGMATSTELSSGNNERQRRPSPPQPFPPSVGKKTSDSKRPELQDPLERKRKRAPEVDTSTDQASNETNRSRQRRTDVEAAPEITLRPTAIPIAGDPSNRKSTPPPRTTNTVPNVRPEKNRTPQPTDKPEVAIDPLFTELPFLPSSPEPEEETQDKDIDSWIDDCLRMGKAQNEDQIIEALRRTSMDPLLAEEVLKYLVEGKRIPDNIRGVWTSEDDKWARGKDARGIERLLEKHGLDLFIARNEYLDMANDAGLEKPADN